MNYKHRLSDHHLYVKYNDMITRCENPKSDRYKNYGGRGISICTEWRNSFELFFEWSMNNGWHKGLSIDRINVNDNYHPNNCRFVDLLAQARNKQNSRIVVYNGASVGLADICGRLNKTTREFKTIYERIHAYNWDAQRAIDTPIRKLISSSK